MVPTPAPAHARARILNGRNWVCAVYFRIDNARRDSQSRCSMRNVLRDMDLDVVGLLETDLHGMIG